MAQRIARLSPLMLDRKSPDTSSKHIIEGNPTNLNVMPMATISASGVERDTHPCLFDMNANGIEDLSGAQATNDPVVER